jgi:hypothetical protein
LDGKTRSPYRDGEEERPGATAQSVAEELDRDPIASGGPWFKAEILAAAQKHLQIPVARGGVFDNELGEPAWREVGDTRLWLDLGGLRNGPAPGRIFTVGCDIAAGTEGHYSSNSTFEALDAITGEQAVEFATNKLDPAAFAEYAVCLSIWLNNAYLCWESNGPTGALFTKAILALGYGNYYRGESRSKVRKKTQSPGWHNSPEALAEVLGLLQNDIAKGDVIIRSKNCLDEHYEYIYKDGNPVHGGSLATDDESAKKKAHGDRVIGMGLANLARRDRYGGKRSEKRKPFPPGSPGWRRQQREQDRHQQAESFN